MTGLPSPRLRLEEWGRALPGIWRAVERERAERRQRDLRWLPPIPVAIEDYTALPAVIRPVQP